MKGTDPESIWVAVDEENKVMYLLNHALMFYPIPTWGMELPLTQDTIDLYKYRGDTFDETEFTVEEEAWDNLSQFIKEGGVFDTKAYLHYSNSNHGRIGI